ncbi:hypothetical protein FSW04_14055 [Baekduia soli]|uniref:Uncharacterized protein n=1 Tax=Baekduia soli TaxID=496014 RepID=A0A5B8U668_9ACTN|nr:hypothetical protein [Baekduia soli]QEC48583.1 hypothetical protein FSW04_14055 [Baekduia soli]
MPTTTTAPKGFFVTRRQRQLITDLALELGREIAVPRSREAASMVIRDALAEQQANQGDTPRPTAKQLRLIEKLSPEDKVPATRQQASARIQQLLDAQKQAATEAVPQAA